MPVSLQGNPEVEYRVLKSLCDRKIVKRVVFSDIDTNLIERCNLRKDDEKYIEYFSYIKSRFGYMDKSKWRSANGINRIRENKDVEFKSLELMDIAGTKKLYNSWVQWKEEFKKEKVYRKNKIELVLGELLGGSNEIIPYVVKYKGKVVYLIVYNVLVGKCLGLDMNVSFTNSFLEIEDEFSDYLKKYINDYAVYKSYEDLSSKNYDICFSGYAIVGSKSGKGLNMYKERTNDDKIIFSETEPIF